jgi:hypothetical protein
LRKPEVAGDVKQLTVPAWKNRYVILAPRSPLEAKMTSALAIRPAALASLGLAAMLVALAPAGSRAEAPCVLPFETLSLGLNDTVERNGQGAAPSVTSTDEPATTGENTLAENAWDFTNPDSIPGFASTPYPVLSNPEIAD